MVPSIRKSILINTRDSKEIGGTLYQFTCLVKIDGHTMRMQRYVGCQESFYVPYVINGMRIWFDAVPDIFEIINENHGVCKPQKQARFAVNDAVDSICPGLKPWCPIESNYVGIEQCYGGDDCWMGAYQGTDAHGGLDINHPGGTPIWAPLDMEDQYLFNSVEAGDNNNEESRLHKSRNQSIKPQAHR